MKAEALVDEEVKVLSFDVGELFAGESATWKWCKEAAAFSHRDACEFMIYVGDGLDAHLFSITCGKAAAAACDPLFIQCLRLARDRGFTWAMFHVG